MYLNVTDLTTYNVDHDSFCIRWTPHRAATSYRLRANPLDRECLTPAPPRPAPALALHVWVTGPCL